MGFCQRRLTRSIFLNEPEPLKYRPRIPVFDWGKRLCLGRHMYSSWGTRLTLFWECQTFWISSWSRSTRNDENVVYRRTLWKILKLHQDKYIYITFIFELTSIVEIPRYIPGSRSCVSLFPRCIGVIEGSRQILPQSMGFTHRWHNLCRDWLRESWLTL
jgi:hypothetical protein